MQILTQCIKFPICDTYGLVLDLESKQTTRKHTSETTLKKPAVFHEEAHHQKKRVMTENSFPLNQVQRVKCFMKHFDIYKSDNMLEGQNITL